MDQYSAPTTTADSQASGRLKVASGCSHGKTKCLKCAMGKKDGKGGPGFGSVGSGSFGGVAAPSSASIFGPLTTGGKKHKSLSIPGGLKPKGQKALKFSMSPSSSLMKGMKLPKMPKATHGMKMRSLKAILKGN